MTEKKKTYLIYAALIILTLVAGWFGVRLPDPPFPEPLPGEVATARGLGIANFTNDVVMDQDLSVAGAMSVAGSTALGSAVVMEGATANDYETTLTTTDPSADRTITLPNMSGTVLVTNTPKILAFGTNTVTTTLTLSHGIVGPTQVFCTLTQDSEANGAACSSTISSDTIVLKLWKADGATAGSVGKQIAWMVVGPGQ